MSLDFKLHYDRLREGDPTKPDASTVANEEGTFYDGPSHARNLCLVWPDGKRQFANYAYLVGGAFTPGDETNEITLNFSDGTLTLRGYSLEPLFDALLSFLPKLLVVADKRYALPSDTGQAIITDAVFQPRL